MSKQDRRGAIDQALDQMFEDEDAAMREMHIIENEIFGYEESKARYEAAAKVKRDREKQPLRKMRGSDGY